MWQNEYFFTCLYQTLCTLYGLSCECMLSERCRVFGSDGCDLYFFLLHWMKLGQVFLILLCVIFEHGYVAFYLHHFLLCFHAAASGCCVVLEGLAALIGWLDLVWVNLSWGKIWWSMSYDCQTILIYVSDLHSLAYVEECKGQVWDRFLTPRRYFEKKVDMTEIKSKLQEESQNLENTVKLASPL